MTDRDQRIRIDKILDMLDATFEELRKRRIALAWKTFAIGFLLALNIGLVIEVLR